MDQPNPATPAQAATPGSGRAVATTPAVATPAAGTPAAGGQPAGTVTITTKEFADLQRAKARSLAFDRRKEFSAGRNSAPQGSNMSAEPGDQAQAAADARVQEAEQRLMRAEVRNSVRDILEKPEYANLPASTKALILKNPAMLSEADNVDEALLDIEDFIIDQVTQLDSGGIPVTVKGPEGQGSRPSETPGHETPSVNASGPSGTENTDAEDVSKLTGSQRSRAIIRNKLRGKS